MIETECSLEVVSLPPACWIRATSSWVPSPGLFNFSLLCVTGLSFERTKLTVLFALLCVGQQEDVSSAPLLCLFLVDSAKFVLTQPSAVVNLFFSFFYGGDCDAHFIPRGKRLGLTREGGQAWWPGKSCCCFLGNRCSSSLRSAICLSPSWWECLRAGDDQMLWESGLLQKKKLKPDTAQPQSLWEILCLWLLQRRLRSDFAL